MNTTEREPTLDEIEAGKKIVQATSRIRQFVSLVFGSDGAAIMALYSELACNHALDNDIDEEEFIETMRDLYCVDRDERDALKRGIN